MTSFDRRGHYRTNAYGTTFWVSGHGVNRDDWNRAQFAANLRKADAISYLHRHAARTISGCYVNPNARCPVCREPVFFYANRFGSRVFFDELGPAWTKHPCTDNPQKPVNTSHLTYTPPAHRKTGERLELLRNAQTAGFVRTKFYGNDNEQWHLLVVNSVLRSKTTSIVVCECITLHPTQEVRFTIVSAEPVFDVGDFVNKRGGHFSFLHRDSMTVVRFLSGNELKLPSLDPKPSARAFIGRAEQTPQINGLNSIFTNINKRLKLLTPSERSQFVGDGSKLDQLGQTLKPVIQEFWKEKTLFPDGISAKLNALGYRTASGDEWTPRLTAILLAIFFGGPPRLPKLPKSPRKIDPPLATKEAEENTLPEVIKPSMQINTERAQEVQQQYAREDLARRLAVIGRVKVSRE
jgi:hypothetical protein